MWRHSDCSLKKKCINLDSRRIQSHKVLTLGGHLLTLGMKKHHSTQEILLKIFYELFFVIASHRRFLQPSIVRTFCRAIAEQLLGFFESSLKIRNFQKADVGKIVNILPITKMVWMTEYGPWIWYQSQVKSGLYYQAECFQKLCSSSQRKLNYVKQVTFPFLIRLLSSLIQVAFQQGTKQYLLYQFW